MVRNTEKTKALYEEARKYIEQGLTVGQACAKSKCAPHNYYYWNGKNGLKRKYKKRDAPSVIPLTQPMSKVVVFEIPTQSLPSFIASLQ